MKNAAIMSEKKNTTKFKESNINKFSIPVQKSMSSNNVVENTSEVQISNNSFTDLTDKLSPQTLSMFKVCT